MRPKVIIPAVCLAMLILLPAWFLGRGTGTSAHPAQTAAILATPGLEIPMTHPSLHNTSASNSNQPDEDSAAKETERMAAVSNRVAELRYLATTGDPHSLVTILSELPNRDPAIRRAAVAAAVEFGDRTAIPALNEALESTPDPQEKVNIQKAVDYLQLPSLKERDGAGITSPATVELPVPATN